MNQPHTHLRVLFGNMTSDVLGTIYGAVLAAGAAERHHEILESARLVFLYRVIYDAIDVSEELLHGFFLVEEGDDGFIASGDLFVLVVASGIVYGATVENEATSITAIVAGNASFVRETGDAYGEFGILFVGFEERERSELAQQIGEVRQVGKLLMQQCAQIVDCHGDALHKMCLVLKISSITVGSQHL